MARLFLTLVAAVGIGIGILSSVDTEPASAFVPPTTGAPPYTDGIDRSERLKVFKEVLTKSESGKPIEKAASRRILTRAMSKVASKPILRVGTKAGLAGAAVGAWAVVGYELKYAAEIGNEESIKVPLSLAPAPGAQYTFAWNGEGKRSGVSYMTRLSWSVYENNGKRYKMAASYKDAVENWLQVQYYDGPQYEARFGMIGVYGVGDHVRYVSGLRSPDLPDDPQEEVADRALDVSVRYRAQRAYRPGPGMPEITEDLGGDLCKSVGCGFDRTFPTFAVGPSAPLSYPEAPAYSSSGSEADQIVDSVVADPEAPTVVPELPEPDDPFWTDPDAPRDPDGDRDDDGLPDESDPNPTRPAAPPADDPFPDPAPGDPGHDPTAPNSDPDEDGQPNETDPDDDGDGLPDTEDPNPDRPDPAPDADQDGDPDQSDPDDDNDGIPDEDDPQPKTPTAPGDLPVDHPYADPDKDGTPNRNDGDDDGDGVPDTEDPAPNDPTQPEPDPNADRDGDDVPDKIDPEPSNPAEPSRYTETDTDGDGSPDPYDPSPNDPADPAGGPEGNPDGDGSPNRHDPYPNNPNRPASNPDGDLDEDGTPNRNDPDPYRPAQPAGGPSGDADQDGTPNAQDPAPTDESKPATERGGSCPIAPPRARIEGPDGAMSAIFPFNMFIMAVENIKVLGAPPKAPPLPILFPDAQAGVEKFSLSEFDPQAALARTILSVAGSIFCGFFIYKLASQSKEGD